MAGLAAPLTRVPSIRLVGRSEYLGVCIGIPLRSSLAASFQSPVVEVAREFG